MPSAEPDELHRLALAALVCARRSPCCRRRSSRGAATPVFSTDVSLVLLPVFVVDQRRPGRARAARRGLRASRRTASARGRLVPLRGHDRSAEDQDELRAASAARRRFLLLFDKSFTDLRRASTARAARPATSCAGGSRPSDLAAVATFDVERGLRLVANFTEDRALLAHADRRRSACPRSRGSATRSASPRTSADHRHAAGRARRGDERRRRGRSTASPRAVARRMRAADEQPIAHNVEHAAGGLDALARGPARRGGPQAGALLLGRLRLARCWSARRATQRQQSSTAIADGPALGGRRPAALRRQPRCASRFKDATRRACRARRHRGALDRRDRLRRATARSRRARRDQPGDASSVRESSPAASRSASSPPRPAAASSRTRTTSSPCSTRCWR